MNEKKPEKGTQSQKSWLPYSLIIAFGFGFALGYQMPIKLLIKEPIFVDLSKELTNEPQELKENELK